MLFAETNYIPSGVTQIGTNAFNNCGALTDYLHFTSSTLQNAESIVQSTLESWKLIKEEEMQTMRMRMSFNGETVFVTLNDNSATQDLIARLQIAPVTLLFRDFGGSEKIGYPEPALDVSNVSGCDPDVGDLTIYKPWGNLAAFYRDTAGYSDSLVPIGKIENVNCLPHKAESFPLLWQLHNDIIAKLQYLCAAEFGCEMNV